MPKTDAVLAVLLLAGSVGLWTGAERFPETAAIFPRVTLVALAALGAVLLVQSLFSPSHSGSGLEGAHEGGAIRRPLAVFALAAGAVLLMPVLGFFPVIAMFTGLLLPVLSVEKRRLYVITIVVLLLCVYLVFTLLLDVPLATVWGAD